MPTKTTDASPQKPKRPETTAFQVRLDAEVHATLKKAAEDASISLNQLVTGILRGCADNMHLGEGRIRDGVITIDPTVAQCVTFGERPQYEEDFGIAEAHGQRIDDGVYWFGLDFSDRGYVRR